MGAGVHVPFVAVSVSPAFAVPDTVGAVWLTGPPAPLAVVVNAATATMAAVSASAIGRK